MTIVNVNNNGDSRASVEHYGDKVQLILISHAQGRHTVSHSVIFDNPEDALKLAEGIREAAAAAKTYEENNP